PLTGGAAPEVLASSPALGQTLDDSPLVLRPDFDQAIDPVTINTTSGDPAQTVRLVASPTPDFSGTVSEVSASAAYSYALNELQLCPAGPLVPAYYRLLVNFNGNPLAPGAVDPAADYALAFHVNGAEGLPAPDASLGVIPADDTPATAHELTFAADGTA